MRHGETITHDKLVWRDNLRGAFQEDRYTTGDGEMHTLQPRFTMHGFRYAEGLGLFKDRIRVLPEAAAGLKACAQDKLGWLDGLMDGNEDADRDGFHDANETDPNDLDTDDDFLQDGLELGLTAPQGDDTNLGVFTPDTNPAIQSLPLDDDTDDDGLLDGNEDANHNGNREPSETRVTIFDTDGDGLGDGQELGLTAPQGGDTDLADFVADADDVVAVFGRHSCCQWKRSRVQTREDCDR